MRVLFVLKQIDYEPQGILHLSSALKAAGHEVALAVASMEDPVQFAVRFAPHVVAYSVTTGAHRYYLELNRRLREHVNAFSAFGGPHATFFPEMIEEEGVDGVCRGEGEEALLELISALERGEPVSGIANWWIKADGRIYRNPVRPLIADLDALPLPDRKLVYDKDRFTRRSGLKHFITGRGCPYNCTYCFNQGFNELYRGKGRLVRRRSVDNVLEELRQVKADYPLEFVVFLDDTFIVPADWVEEFCRRYPQAVGLPFFCNVRANLVTRDLMRQLREAGCVSVGMGIETADDRLRNELLERHMSRQQIIAASQIIGEKGIQLITTNMLGLPTGSLATDLATLELNVACRPGYANAFLYQPYPRTALGDFAQRQGLMEGSFDDISSSAWDRSILRFASPEEKRQVENLNKLFAIAVEWPWLLPLVRWLIRWPRNGLFRLAYKLWKGYAIKQRIHPYRPSLAEYVETVQRFMRFD
ncbi:MAG: radical SAM protein [Anaerolineae bacterium]|nr:radical SAM protein [Anaerolineae bacterium]